jgi:hypothetical protein
MDLHGEIAALAYSMWQEGQCVAGTAQIDWFRAEEELRVPIPNAPSRLAKERLRSTTEQERPRSGRTGSGGTNDALRRMAPPRSAILEAVQTYSETTDVIHVVQNSTRHGNWPKMRARTQ